MNNIIDMLRSPSEITGGVAARMVKRRKEQKLTQKELSERAGVSLGSLKRFERTGEISLLSLVKISFALGCEEDMDGLFAKKGYASIQEVIDEQV